MTPAEQSFCEDMLEVMRKHCVGLAIDRSVGETIAFGERALRAPKFVIHMIGFNNLVLSKYCIESVLEHSPRGAYRLILTNNGSTDGTKEYFDDLAAQHSQITVIHNAANEGFQGPNEVSFKMAHDMGATYHISLNNDATVPAGWLEKLAEPMDADPRVVITGPMGGCSRLNSQMQGCDDTKTEYIEGSAMAVAVSAIWERWGRLFSPDLSFIYHEDSELSLRVQYAGWKIQKCPFRIQHRGSQTAGAHPEAKARCAEANARNQAVMLKKYAHWNKVRRFDHPIIVRRKYATGDVLLATPIIRALKKKYALCPIYVETGAYRLFDNNPYVVQASETAPPLNDAMVIDLDNAYEQWPSQHVIDSYADVAGLERSEVERRLEYFGTTISRPLAGKWCAMHIGPTAWPGKNWPVPHWNRVAQHLRQHGWKVLLLGSPPKDASMLVDLDLRGQDGYGELAALLKQCALFIGPCSFPLHLAQAVGTPVIGLFGITDPKCFLTDERAIAVCSDPAHPDTGRRNREANVTYIQTDDSVMRTITVEHVVQAVKGVGV